MKFEVGKKYRLKYAKSWFEVLFIGETDMFIRDWHGEEGSVSLVEFDYEEYKETKKILMASALYAFNRNPHISGALFVSLDQAKRRYGSELLAWPSHPDDLKEYEVPVE